MQSTRKSGSVWRGGNLRDAVAVAGLCLAVYAAAEWFGLFDRAYAFAKRHDDLGLGGLVVAAVAFAGLAPMFALRRIRKARRDLRAAPEPGVNVATDASRLAIAFNNISQGVLMFDANERLVVCNDYYLKMYGFSAAVIKPGASFRDIIRYRMESGMLKRDAEEYRAELLKEFASMRIVRASTRTPDGRDIAITNYPMADGGWVTTHEDRTDLLLREASFRLLFDNNPVPMCVFDRKTSRFLAVNDAALSQYGYSRARFLTMSLFDIRAGEHESTASLLRALPEDQDGEYVGQHRRADGTKFHVVVHSRILNFEGCEARLAAIHDVTERMTVEHDLRRTKIFLDTVIENVPLPIVVKTIKDGRFTLVNKASEELHGYKREETIGKTLFDIFPRERADQIVTQDTECTLLGHPIVIGDHVIPTPKGDRVVTSKKVIIPGDSGKPEFLLTLIEDVTERRQAEQRIVHLAHSDPLTDLPNRTAFNERLAALLKIAEAEARCLAILCMDLDSFKEVNDIYGHAVGDSLLCQVANRLREAADGAFIARLGGDEFTIVAETHDRVGIVGFTDRLLAKFAEPFVIDALKLTQALSIGVATYPADGADAITLMKNADAALYRAKARGRGAVQFFEANMALQVRERASLQADLELAIQRNELRLAYQPQLRMTGEIIGFEALARWHSPTRGIVPPADFIPIAEESGAILSLGEWVLREACREAVSWKRPLGIAINVSPVQFRQGDLARLVHEVLLETGLAPWRLELEITEGVLIDNFSHTVSVLRRLKSLGVQIVLDDFGTGYSSLSYLRAFPFDKIKLDSSFIAGVGSNRHSIAIVRAVIGLSRSLRIPILAEGVETPTQHAFLEREGCNQVQGYLTGRPQAIDDYAKVVGKGVSAAARAHAG